MNARRCCTECREPIMMISAHPVSEIGTNLVVQVAKFGCLNSKCDMYGVVVDKTETPYDIEE
jgi:hypothetical protein